MQSADTEPARCIGGEAFCPPVLWTRISRWYANGAPAVIVGDLNADVANLPSLQDALDETRVDVGANGEAIGSPSHAPTCDMGVGFSRIRRDYINHTCL